MERCPKDESTAKTFVEIKALPIPEKNWKNLFCGWHPQNRFFPPLAIGGLKAIHDGKNVEFI